VGGAQLRVLGSDPEGGAWPGACRRAAAPVVKQPTGYLLLEEALMA